ncbi:hypothetical protein V8D89_000571 [Ganoderma adspersum]
MTLDEVLPFLSSFLDLDMWLGMKNRIQDHLGISLPLSNIPEALHAGSRKDNSVQTDDEIETLSLQAALEDKEHEVERLRKKIHRDSQHVHSIKIKLETTTRRLEKAEADRIASNQRAQQMETRLYDAERRTNKTIAQLTRELHQCQSELEVKAALLDTRSAELRDAQAYLTMLDDVTDAEVLQLVNGINSRIFQVAANIAGAFQPRYGEQKDVQVAAEAATRLGCFLDDGLLLALNAIHHADDTLIMQTALQAGMVSCTRWLCATWDFQTSDTSCLLQHIYQSIRRAEPQSIAGRWRALSRTYVKTFLADAAHRERIAADRLLDSITDVLLAGGISVPRQDLRMEIERGYVDRLREVIHASHEFQHITGECVISRDLLVVTANPEEPFDPSRMVDEWAGPKRARRSDDPHPVVCTTQLGLVREERKTPEGMGGEVGITEVVLLKPKVVLTSLLEELWNEQDRGPCKT